MKVYLHKEFDYEDGWSLVKITNSFSPAQEWHVIYAVEADDAKKTWFPNGARAPYKVEEWEVND